jgi:hypothetical protein
MLAPPVLVSRLCTLCTLYCGAVLGGTPPLYGKEVLVASPRHPARKRPPALRACLAPLHCRPSRQGRVSSETGINESGLLKTYFQCPPAGPTRLRLPAALPRPPRSSGQT